MSHTGWKLLAGALRSGGVVCYHGIVRELASSPVHVSAASFESQVDFISNVFEIVPLAELVARRERRKSIAGCLSLTFDDAYEGVLSIGDEILRKRSLPATIFVASTPSVEGTAFWWDVVEHLLRRADGGILARLLKENGAPQEIAASREMGRIRDWILEERRGLLDLRTLHASESPDPHLRAMSEGELRQLARDPRWTFAGHTASHPVLPLLAEPDQEREIGAASAWLKDRFGNVLPFVAYPYGFFNGATLRAAAATGLTAGFTMDARAPRNTDPALALPRVGLSEDTRKRTTTLRLSGVMRDFIARRDGAPASARFNDPAPIP